MTINGPASIICAFFMNAAIDQQCELYIKEWTGKGSSKKTKAIFKEKGVNAHATTDPFPKGMMVWD